MQQLNTPVRLTSIVLFQFSRSIRPSFKLVYTRVIYKNINRDPIIRDLMSLSSRHFHFLSKQYRDNDYDSKGDCFQIYWLVIYQRCNRYDCKRL